MDKKRMFIKIHSSINKYSPKKYYYTLHLQEKTNGEWEYIRIFGKFSNIMKTVKRAEELAKQYDCKVEKNWDGSFYLFGPGAPSRVRQKHQD